MYQITVRARVQYQDETRLADKRESMRLLSCGVLWLTLIIATTVCAKNNRYTPFPAHHKHLAKYNSKLVSDQTQGWTHTIVSSQELWIVAVTHGATIVNFHALVASAVIVEPCRCNGPTSRIFPLFRTHWLALARNNDARSSRRLADLVVSMSSQRTVAEAASGWPQASSASPRG